MNQKIHPMTLIACEGLHVVCFCSGISYNAIPVQQAGELLRELSSWRLRKVISWRSQHELWQAHAARLQQMRAGGAATIPQH